MDDPECPLRKQMRPKHAIYDSELVAVSVGDAEKRIYHVHKDLLCHYSSYFKGAFKGGFPSTATGTIHLNDTSTQVFDAFRLWIYSGRFFDGTEEYLAHQDTTKQTLCEIWVFADMRGAPVVKNAAIDLIISRWGNVDTRNLAQHIAYIYANTTSGAPLRALSVRMVSHRWATAAEWIRAARKEGCLADGMQAYLEDLVLAFDIREGPVPTVWDLKANFATCEFHDHDLIE